MRTQRPSRGEWRRSEKRRSRLLCRRFPSKGYSPPSSNKRGAAGADALIARTEKRGHLNDERFDNFRGEGPVNLFLAKDWEKGLLPAEC